MMTRFEVVSDKFRKHPDVNIMLPKRGTKNSAGYDFYLPCDLVVPPHSTVSVALDVKAKLTPTQVLLLFVRSSIGIKHDCSLPNGVAVIDSDYYSNKSNDGNIMVSLYNHSDETRFFMKGERVIQGVITYFCVTGDDNASNERTGGIGSTSK